MGLKLLSTLQTYIPSMTPTSLLLLNLEDLETVKQLPVSLLIGSTLSCIWMERTTRSRVCAYKVRSQLEQTINLLRTTRLASVADTLSIMTNEMFQ